LPVQTHNGQLYEAPGQYQIYKTSKNKMPMKSKDSN
jgi:hypothetical protein